MRQTLFYIQDQVADIPVFGVGLFLVIWSVLSIGLIGWLVRRQGFNADTLGYLPIIALVAVVGVIIIALTAIYLLILKPMQQTLVKATNNISSMAQSIQITAEALKYSTEKQQKIMDYIEHSPTQCTDK